MFTLKFVGNSLTYDHRTTSVSCYRYETRESGNLISVIVFPREDRRDTGEEYIISTNPRDFASCFVENSAGKTIHRIGPLEKPVEMAAT